MKPLYLNFYVKKRQNYEAKISPKNVHDLWSKLATKKVSHCGRILEPIGFQSSLKRQKTPFQIQIDELK